MPRRTEDAVVVITGGSSGIGRATALAFARRRANVVLAARREQPLDELAAECERLGARALAVPTDVTDEEAVRNLARRAIDTFGRLDVWVNNAAVTLFVRFADAPPDAFQRVIATNLFGYVYGARAAVRQFLKQGSGVLINNASVLGKGGAPYVSAYVTSKFAIVGLAECLRQELRGTDVHVCTILPASIDTPLYQHAANYTGRAVKALRPIYDAEKVARAIVTCAENPRREILVGPSDLPFWFLHTFLPGLYERLRAWEIEVDHFQDRPAPTSSGNLFQPMVEGTGASGGWKAREGLMARPAVFTTLVGIAGLAATLSPLLALLLLGPRLPSLVKR